MKRSRRRQIAARSRSRYASTVAAASSRIGIGQELDHQAARALECRADARRHFGNARVRLVNRAVDMARRLALAGHAPEQPALEAPLARKHIQRRRAERGHEERPTVHAFGPIIASGLTQRSKSCALT